MMVIVDGVQLFNIRGKNAVLPDGVPVLDFTGELPDISSSQQSLSRISQKTSGFSRTFCIT